MSSTLKQVTAFALFLALVAVIAAAGSLATVPNTDGWYRDVEKVPWNPPDSVFGPTWSVLYFLIAVAGFLLWRASVRAGAESIARGRVLRIYALQLILNALWTPIFFAGYPVVGEFAWWAGLVVIVSLIASVVWLAFASKPVSKTAAWIMVPYLLWLTYAATLNAGIIVLN